MRVLVASFLAVVVFSTWPGRPQEIMIQVMIDIMIKLRQIDHDRRQDNVIGGSR